MESEPREPMPDERDPAIKPYPNGFNYPTPPAISDEDRKRDDEIAARLPKPDRGRQKRRRR